RLFPGSPAREDVEIEAQRRFPGVGPRIQKPAPAVPKLVFATEQFEFVDAPDLVRVGRLADSDGLQGLFGKGSSLVVEQSPFLQQGEFESGGKIVSSGGLVRPDNLPVHNCRLDAEQIENT